MRHIDDYTKRGDTAGFAGDLPNGHCIIECPSGYKISTEFTGGHEEPFYDPLTGKEVFYPGWAEW